MFGRAHGRSRRSSEGQRPHRPFANLDRSLFAVHHQPRAVGSDRTAGARLVVVIVDFDLVEVALDLSFTRARLHLHRRIRRNRNLHVAFAVIDLNIPRLAQSDFDRPVRVFQPQIARQAFQRNVFRARRQPHRPDERVGAQVAGIQIQPAIQPRKFHFGARRMKAHRLADSHQAHAFLKLSIQMHRRHPHLPRPLRWPSPECVTSPFTCASRAELPSRVQRDVSRLIVDVDFAAMVIDLDIAAHARDRHVASARSDDESGIGRHINIHVGGHALVARALRVGIQRDDLVGHRDAAAWSCGYSCPRPACFSARTFLRTETFIVFVSATLTVIVPAVVIHVQRAARRNVLAQFVAVVERGPAKNLVQVFIVAQAGCARPRPFQSNATPGSQSVQPDQNSIRKTPPAPMPRAGWP